MMTDLIDREARFRYVERRRKDLINCRESLEHKDFSLLETVGHNLKGNGISFGFPELSALGETLEKSAKQSNFANCQESLNRLETWIENLPAI